MKPPNKRTQLAIDLVSQAYVLERFGTFGLDEERSKTLAQLLKAAAHTLDAKVKGPTE